MLKRLILVCGLAAALALLAYVTSLRTNSETPPANLLAERNAPDPLPPLNAHGVTGVQEISRPELERMMTTARPLQPDETANLNRGCVGLACLYQGLGQKRWPESARDTVAYLTREDALRRRCPNGQQSFIFIKQGWWVGGRPPAPIPDTGEVPISSVTRARPGFYTFNYAVYFPSSATYAWINHRDYGFPVNLINPQKAYLSASPPALDRSRPAQIYCSTCR